MGEIQISDVREGSVVLVTPEYRGATEQVCTLTSVCDQIEDYEGAGAYLLDAEGRGGWCCLFKIREVITF